MMLLCGLSSFTGERNCRPLRMIVWLPTLFALFILSLRTPVFADSLLSDTDRFNFVLGTQTFGPSYHFSDRHPLLETIGVIEE